MPIESVPFPTSTAQPQSASPVHSRASDELDPLGPDTGGSAADWIDRIALSAHQTIDRLAESAAPQVNRLQESLSHAGDSMHQGAERAREVRDEWTESLRCTVREKPLAALGIALAVGVLVARLVR